MHLFKTGQLVKSLAGRDQNSIFVIIEIENEYLYLADGNSRRVENAKKKKKKHVQPTKYILENIKQKIDNDEVIKNEEIRKELADYLYNPDLIKEDIDV